MKEKNLIEEHYWDIEQLKKHAQLREENTTEIVDLFKPWMSAEDVIITENELEMQWIYADNYSAKEISFDEYLQDEDIDIAA